MEWKTAIPKFRKIIGECLETHGCTYKGQSYWERSIGRWRGRFEFQIISRREERLVHLAARLIKSTLLTPEQAKQMGGFGLPNMNAYAVYSIGGPVEEFQEN